MATFSEMRNNLRYFLMGGLGLATPDGSDVYGQLINRAYSDLFEAYDWSYRLTNTVVDSAAPKSAGTITVQQGSPAILGTGTNFTLADVGAFIWIGSPGGGTPLPISDVSGPQLATLTNPFAGGTLINTSYVVCPRYYLVEDALEVLTVVCQDWKLDKRLLEELNDLDPCRTDQGGAPSMMWCQAPPSPDGSVMIELYPIPADSRGYLVSYRRRAPKLIRDGDTPLIKSILIEEKATITGAEMMFASTGQQSWMAIRNLHHENLYGDGGTNIGMLQEQLTQDAHRVQYLGYMTTPGPAVNSGFDAIFTPDHSGQDDFI